MVAGREESTRGRISIGSRVVNDPARKIHLSPDRRRLRMVFQSYAIWPHMTVFDNVAYPLRVRRKPDTEIRQRVAKALELVEMDRYAERPAPALSGGQQQRVAIARALVFEPEVLLLDEPLSNLDARSRTQMGDEFRSLQKRLGITTLYVTHDQDEAMALSDRVVVMRAGKILQVGPPQDTYQRPNSEAIASFFGAPNLPDATVTTVEAATDLSKLGVRAGRALPMAIRDSRPATRSASWSGLRISGQKRCRTRSMPPGGERFWNRCFAVRGVRFGFGQGRESCGSRFRHSLIPRLEQPSESAPQGLRFGPSPVPKQRRSRLPLRGIWTYCCASSVGRDQQPGNVP
jgi:ABC-type Fe3+/spermidine/putrescine transport system ATPase subunit